MSGKEHDGAETTTVRVDRRVHDLLHRYHAQRWDAPQSQSLSESIRALLRESREEEEK